jgi:hypothetical protein
MTAPVSIPFWYTIQESLLFEVKVSGMMRIENEQLLLEYRIETDNLNKMLIYLRRKLKGSFNPEPIESGAIQRTYLDPKNIIKTEITSSWFKPVALLYMAGKDLATFESIPGQKAGTLELLIRKKDLKELREILKALGKER